MFGVGQFSSDEGYIWMLGTDELYDYKRDFTIFHARGLKK